MSTIKLRQDARKIFDAGLQAVDPKIAVHKSLKCESERLEARGQTYQLSDFNNIFVVGAGKAGAPMAAAVEEILRHCSLYKALMCWNVFSYKLVLKSGKAEGYGSNLPFSYQRVGSA